MLKLDKMSSSIVKHEAGYWDDPIGGPTNHGITQKTLNGLRVKYPKLPQYVKELDTMSAKLIIEEEYLKPFSVHRFPGILGMVHAHMVVMSWNDGIRILQKRLNLSVDGIVGPKTLSKVLSQSFFEILVGAGEDVAEFIRTRTVAQIYSASYERRFTNVIKGD